MGPQDPKDVTKDTARELSALVGEPAALKGDATHWLTDHAESTTSGLGTHETPSATGPVILSNKRAGAP
jgi:hypothetical protein